MSKTERIYRLNRLLQNRRVISRRELQEALEVSPATLTRDIEFMRDQLGLPLAYDRGAHGYYYTEPVTSFPTVQVRWW